MRSSSFCALCAVPSSVLVLSCRPPETAVVPAPEPIQPVVEFVSTQEILTPLPLRVWLPARYGADRVLVFFKTWGSRRWDSLELARADQMWAGEISCREVSTVTGDTHYYFLAVDTENRAVIGSGWPEWPHVATVVSKLPDGPRSLAGMAPPNRCHDPADCPPDFLGCPAYAVRRPACHENADCRGDTRCDWDGYCSEASPTADLGSDDAELAVAVRVALRKKRQVASSQYLRVR
jgi:hypothetical protein